MSIDTSLNHELNNDFYQNLNIADSLSQMDEKQLSHLKSEALAAVIMQSQSVKSSSLDPFKCYQTLGKKMHHLKVKVGLKVLHHLFASFQKHRDRDHLIASLIGNINPNYLGEMLTFDGGQVSHSLDTHARKIFKRYKDHGRLDTSIKYEINLFGLSNKQLAKLDFAIGIQRHVEAAKKVKDQKTQEALEQIEKSQGKYASEWSKKILMNRESLSNELLRLKVFANQRLRHLEWFSDVNQKVGTARTDAELMRTVKFIYAYHDRHAIAGNRYIVSKGYISVGSPFTSQDIAKLKDIIASKSSSLEEKKSAFLDLNREVMKNLERKLKWGAASVHLLTQAFIGIDKSEASKIIKEYLDHFEWELTLPFMKRSRQLQDLQKVIRTKGSFLSHLDRLADNKEKLINCLQFLEKRLHEASDIESEVRRLIPQSSRDAKTWSEFFLNSYRLEHRVTQLAFHLLFWAKSNKHLLSPESQRAIDISELNPGLDLLKHTRREQLLSYLSTLTQSSRQDANMGLHQLIAWQIQQVKTRLQELGVTAEHNDESDEESEGLHVVEKLASLGFNPDTFSLEPFNIPIITDADETINWKAYADLFLENGICYGDIKDIDSYNDFVDFYLNDRPRIQVARKIASLGLAPADREISLREYIQNGERLLQKGISYEAIKHLNTDKEFFRWVASKELISLPNEILVMIFSYLSSDDIQNTQRVNQRFWDLLL